MKGKIKVIIFKKGWGDPLNVQAASNPADLDIDIDSEYYGDALKVIPKEHRQDIKDCYMTLVSLTPLQLEKLKTLSELYYIRDGRFKGFKKKTD